MDFFEKLRKQIRNYLFIIIVTENIVLLGVIAVLLPEEFLPPNELIAATAIAGIIVAAMLASLATDYTTEPLKKLWQAIQHVAPHGEAQPAPQLNKLHLGQELVASLANHVYQLASVADGVSSFDKPVVALDAEFVASTMPLPLLVLDKDENIVYLNEAASKYLDTSLADVKGQNLNSALNMSFASDHTFDSWLQDAKQHTVIANSAWARVRIGLADQAASKQFDLAAHYNKANPLGYETMLVLFDHTQIYGQDDQAMSFVALSVHELRTPLTLLRGYIEVFDDELGPGLSPELKDFMKKMDASAQQLAQSRRRVVR